MAMAEMTTIIDTQTIHAMMGTNTVTPTMMMMTTTTHINRSSTCDRLHKTSQTITMAGGMATTAAVVTVVTVAATVAVTAATTAIAAVAAGTTKMGTTADVW
jgi:hypothetical protein